MTKFESCAPKTPKSKSRPKHFRRSGTAEILRSAKKVKVRRIPSIHKLDFLFEYIELRKALRDGFQFPNRMDDPQMAFLFNPFTDRQPIQFTYFLKWFNPFTKAGSIALKINGKFQYSKWFSLRKVQEGEFVSDANQDEREPGQTFTEYEDLVTFQIKLRRSIICQEASKPPLRVKGSDIGIILRGEANVTIHNELFEELLELMTA